MSCRYWSRARPGSTTWSMSCWRRRWPVIATSSTVCWRPIRACARARAAPGPAGAGRRAGQSLGGGVADRTRVRCQRAGADRAVARGGDARNVSVIRLLLDHSVDPNMRDTGYGATPAGWAEHHGQNEAHRLLAAVEQPDGSHTCTVSVMRRSNRRSGSSSPRSTTDRSRRLPASPPNPRRWTRCARPRPLNPVG